MFKDNLFAINQIYTKKFTINKSLKRFQILVGVKQFCVINEKVKL